MSEFEITFAPIGRKGKCRDDETILDCARGIGIGISAVCGGHGTCKTCRLQLAEGTLTKPTPDELAAFSKTDLKEGWRLACQARPTSDCRFTIPTEALSASERIHLDGTEQALDFRPPLKAYDLELKEPSLHDQVADADRIIAALKKDYGVECNRVDSDVLFTLSPNLREQGWKCRATVRNGELIAVGKPKTRQLGMAVDLGTTTMAAYLVDMDTGETLSTQGVMNPQIGYGEDIISRIDYVVKHPKDRKRMQKLAVKKLNELASLLCKKAGLRKKDIVEACVVGNTAMHHLLLGLPVRQLVTVPFISSASLPLDVKAHELGIRLAPGAYLHCPPVITGFVGADHIAMLQAINPDKMKGLTIALDIGTNTEISLIKGKKMITTSCASGPAFEGGHIQQGMRAAKGAIERLRLVGDDIQFQTIENSEPIGICGSGVMDALDQLRKGGVFDGSGRFNDSHPLVRKTDGMNEFVIFDRDKKDDLPPIVITQRDVRELQLAKAAIRAGIQILLETDGSTEDDIEQVIIAGAFGQYIDLTSAVDSGLLPCIPHEKFTQVGNAAGIGAKMALLSTSVREQARDIVKRSHYIELASTENFNKEFVIASHIGRYRIIDGKRVDVE